MRAGANANAVSGTSGNAVNGTGIFALGGLGGDAGITLVRAGPGGLAVNISVLTIGMSSAVGGSSVATFIVAAR